jgi:predicted site-specific integrase-resolvase
MMPINIDGETYLNTAETCRAVGVSRETLNRYVQDGLIRRYKRGLSRTAYYKETDVQELARKRFEIREDTDN